MTLPRYGEYIVFQLDPQANLERLNDPEAMEACRTFRPKKYVACTSYVRSLLYFFRVR